MRSGSRGLPLLALKASAGGRLEQATVTLGRVGMVGAAPNEHVASVKRYKLRVIEEHIDFAGENDIVHGVGAVWVRHIAWLELHHGKAAAVRGRCRAKDTIAFVFTTQHPRWTCIRRPHQR